MTTDIIEDTHPTRMELIEINKKIILAQKGHKLLKQKRDSLMAEFMKRIDEARGPRQMLNSTMNKAYSDLISAISLMSLQEVEAISAATPEIEGVEISFTNIIGVKVPEIRFKGGLTKERYGIAFTSTKLDEAVADFEQALKEILKLIETEEAIRLLGEEIKMTRRRVNALEYIMIPRLQNTRRYIKMRLEEMERESFVRLKMVKAKKERERIR